MGAFYSCLFFERHDLGWRLSWSCLQNFKNKDSSNSLSRSLNSLVKVFLISVPNLSNLSEVSQENRKSRMVPLNTCYKVDFPVLTLFYLHSVFFLFVTSVHECFLLFLFVCLKWKQFR